MTLLEYKLWLGCLLTVTTLNTCFALTIDRYGGYENIVIAISSDTQLTSLKEQTNLINNLKTLLQTTSNSLRAASAKKFYFKNAVILVPQTWQDQPNLGRTDGPYLYKEADVRVVGTKQSPQPYVVTQQPRDCGEPGEFIQIKNPDMFFRMNCPACTFLKHWAQYRYGIFDESGIKGSKVFPPVYRDADGWKVTGCDYPNPYTFSKPEYFCPPREGFTGQDFTSYGAIKPESSIMSETNQATSFCEEHHNAISPTPHNAFCKHLSTWEVIKESEDFKLTTTTLNAVPQMTFQVFKRNEIKAVIVLDPTLCKNAASEKVTKTVAYSVAQIISLKFRPEILGIFIGEEYIGTSVADVSKIFADECTNENLQGRENLPKAAELIQETNRENFGAIIFIANGNSYNDLKRIEFLNNTLHKNIRLHVVAYPPLTRILIDPDFNQHRYTVHSIPMDSYTRAKCDLQARVTFDQIFHSLFSLYTNDISRTQQMINAPIYVDEEVSGEKSFRLYGMFTMTAYFCDPIGLPHLKWNDGVQELEQIHTAHTVQNVHPISIQSSSRNSYTFNPGENIPYALTFWMEGSSEDQEFRTSVEPAKFPKKNPFPGIPPQLRAVMNAELPYVFATYTDVVTKKTFKLELRNSSQIGRGTAYKNTFSGSAIRFSKKPTTYSVVIKAADHPNRTSATHTIRSFATFSTTMIEPYYNYFLPNRITDLAVVDIFHSEAIWIYPAGVPDNAVTFKWTQSGYIQDSSFARDYYLRCKTYQGAAQDEFDNIGLEDEMLNNTEITYEWPGAETGILYYCTIKSRGRLFSEPSNMVTVYVPPCLT